MRNLKTPCKTANSFLPANHFQWQGAYILYRPGYGLVYVGFGNGDNAPDDDEFDRDDNGNKIDDYVNVKYYVDGPEEGLWKPWTIKSNGEQEDRSVDGLLFHEHDGFTMVFSHKSYPSADLRDLLKKALKCIGWPIDVEKRYFLMGVEGKFNWDGKPTRKTRR